MESRAQSPVQGSPTNSDNIDLKVTVIRDSDRDSDLPAPGPLDGELQHVRNATCWRWLFTAPCSALVRVSKRDASGGPQLALSAPVPSGTFCACSESRARRLAGAGHGVVGPIRTRRPRAAHGFRSTLQGPGPSGRAPPWPALSGSGRPESPGRALRPRPGIRRAAAAAAGSNADSDIKLLP